MADETIPGGIGAGYNNSPSGGLLGRFKGPKKSIDMDSKGIDAATKSLNALNKSLEDVKKTLGSLTAMNPTVKGLMASLSSVGGGIGGGGGGGGGSSFAGGSYSGGSPGVSMGGGGSLSSPTFTGGGSTAGMFTPSFKADSIGGIVETVGNLMMMPVQFAHNRFEENRGASMKMSQFLGSASMRSGSSIEDLVGSMGKKMPLRGSLDEMMGAVNNASRFGFQVTDNSARSGGFFEASRQLQQLNPSASAGQITGSLGSFMSNSSAVQKSVLFSGGAFSMQGPGGKTKTIQEWAVGLLKFFEGQRPGGDRGKPFSRVQLETQQFPGSNMNAWFQLNQVPEYMVDAFWQYALAARGSTADTSFSDLVSNTRGVDLSFERLKGLTMQTRRDLNFTSAPSTNGTSSNYKNYGTREKADATFQNTLGANLDKGLTEFMNALGVGKMIGNVPTPIADMLYQFLQSAPTIAGQGITAISELVPGDTPVFATGDAPIGDTGYSPLGNTNLNGLTPGMQGKVGAMMKANPNIKITSGYRDGGTQDRLHRRGVGKVAPNGRSAHTRGLAADLGPSSEHAWIAKNASKFGLESGIGHGEPWHVGAPGTVPKMRVGDPPMSGGLSIGDPDLPTVNPTGDLMTQEQWDKLIKEDPELAHLFARDFEGGAVTDVIDAVKLAAEYLPKLAATAKLAANTPDYMLKLISSLTNGGAGLGAIGESFGKDIKSSVLGDLLGKLLGAVGAGAEDAVSDFGGKPTNRGGISRFLEKSTKSAADASAKAGASIAAAGASIGSSAAGGGITNSGGSGGISNLVAKYHLPNVASAQVGAAQKQKMQTVLQAASGAGFKGDDLVMITALAGKESGWNPMAYNGKGPDNSYGLFQINMKGSLGPARLKQYGLTSNDQLFDPNVSARVAKKIYDADPSLRPWGLATASDQNRAATAKYLQPVYDTAKEMGYVGDTYGGGSASGGSASLTVSPRNYSASHSSPTYIQVHAPITVQSNNRSGGDMKALASVLAENLAPSIRKELSR